MREIICPRCYGPMQSNARTCKPCRTAALRNHCVYCGRCIDAHALTCGEHRSLPALDPRYNQVVEQVL